MSIVGDLHGQFFDFWAMLKKIYNHDQTEEKILFLGDYVDRGTHGPELVLLVIALKLAHPKKIVLL